jgi:acetylornithine deacetylase
MFQDLDRAIEELTPHAFDLLARLVEQPSTVGYERGAQDVLAVELDAAGFTTTMVDIPADIADAPGSGVAQASYDGRGTLVGHRGERGAARSLVINGHVDVVPATEPKLWTAPPFTPQTRHGWLYGRGSADTKSGLTAALLALQALDRARPGWLTGELTVVAPIEEECTGNGTLAACRAGWLGDAAIVLEPTDLGIHLAGCAITWIGLEIAGRPGHAKAAGECANPVAALPAVLTALERLQDTMNRAHRDDPTLEPALAGIAEPFVVNVGEVHAGDWASTVPSVARLAIRVGHPGAWTADETLARVRATVTEACAADPRLVNLPLTWHLTGFRAEGFAQPPAGELIEVLQAAHIDAQGAAPHLFVLGSTTDARFYLNQFGIPAVAYGPRTNDMHGADEAVELDSVVAVARTLARFIASWFAAAEPDRS